MVRKTNDAEAWLEWRYMPRISFMNRYAQSASSPPQSVPLVGRSDEMTKNAAGGFTFLLDPLGRLRRFIVLGTDKGTYYASEEDLTQENLDGCDEAVRKHGPSAVAMIREVAEQRLSAKRKALIYALAACAKHGNDETRRLAYDAVPTVCGTPTDLFDWLECVKALGGFGSGVQRAVRNWYWSRTPQQLAYQMAKYKSREGWTHADALRIAHAPIKADKTEHAALMAWATWNPEKKVKATGEAVLRPGFFDAAECPADAWFAAAWASEQAKQADEARTIKLIADYDLPRECVATEHLKSDKVWGALMAKMPMTALLRNLGNLGKHGLLTPFSEGEKHVKDALAGEQFAKAKPHPVSILLAMGQYATGHGLKGSGTWEVNPRITEALNEALVRSFRHGTATGKRVVLALDVSASMQAPCSTAQAFSCWNVGLVLANAMRSVEKDSLTLRFDTQADTLDFAKNHTNLSSLTVTSQGTDCSAPFRYCKDRNIPADLFVIFTDNETWNGKVHPCVAFEEYRAKVNPKAKAVSVAMTATKGSIADPASPDWLSVVGLDASFPQLVQEWAR